MRFFIRKSINFGGVRFNLSNSGIGAYVGVKGFQIGTSPRGKSIHMGRIAFSILQLKERRRQQICQHSPLNLLSKSIYRLKKNFYFKKLKVKLSL